MKIVIFSANFSRQNAEHKLFVSGIAVANHFYRLLQQKKKRSFLVMCRLASECMNYNDSVLLFNEILHHMFICQSIPAVPMPLLSVPVGEAGGGGG